MNEEAIPSHPDRRVGRAGYVFVALWTGTIAALYAIGGYLGARALHAYREETETRRTMFITTALAPDAERGAAASNRPAEVKVGLFVNRFEGSAVTDAAWTADFDIWFRWSDPRLDPGATFKVANGDIVQRDKVEERVDGTEHYARYAVKATLQSIFDPSRFPFADEALDIQIEDRSQDDRAGRYVADIGESGLGIRGVPPRQRIVKWAAAVKHDADEWPRGAPSAPSDPPRVRSRFVFVMLRAATGWALHVKNFQTLFASVAIALLAFFIKPTWGDGRFGLGVGAIFAAIAGNVAAGGAIPAVDRFTLTAMVNAAGFATIFVTLVGSSLSLYILDTLERDRLRRLFDHASFVVCAVGYAAVNLWLPFAAMPLTSR